MSYASVILADSPVNYWKLNDSVGSATAADSAGSNTLTNDGATFGQTALVAGDTSALFVSNSGTGLTSATTSVTTAVGSSLEAWIKWDTVVVGEETFIRNGAGGSNAYSLLLTQSSGQNRLFVLCEGIAFHDTTYVVDGNVHYVVLTIDTGPAFLVYVDSVQVASFTASVNNPSGGCSVGSAGSTRRWAGLVGEAAIYASVLTPTQITNHYNAGTAAAAVNPTPPLWLAGGQLLTAGARLLAA